MFSDKKVLYPGLIAFLVLTWLLLMTEYHKWGAEWWGVNILIYSVVIVPLIVWGLSRMYWFQSRYRETSWKMFMIPAVAFVLCALLGIYFTEPIEVGGEMTRADRNSADYDYDYGHSRSGGFYYYYFGGSSSASSNSSSSDWDFDSDMDGEGMAYLILILLVILIILASAFVPHFWVLATLTCLAIMGLMVWRDSNLKERRSYSW